MAMLEVKNLKTSFYTLAGEVKAVNDTSFTLERGQVLGIVGESGSGKSVTAYSIMQILTHPGKVIGGSIKFDGVELVGTPDVAPEDYNPKSIYKIRGKKISIIFQDPMTSLNPVYTIGNQLREAIMLHTGKNRKQASERALELLKMVNVNEPEKRLKQFPHELSGGMRQRIMIAMAIACEPDILIADEPTTALDVTIQAQILEVMQELQKKLGLAIIMITHDLGVIAQLCDNVIVMYGGKICEKGTADDIFYRPAHEYTKGLLASIPSVNDEGKPLVPISGTPVDLLNLPAGCFFAPRCKNAMKVCLTKYPEMLTLTDTHCSACWMNVKEAAEDGIITVETVNKEEGHE